MTCCAHCNKRCTSSSCAHYRCCLSCVHSKDVRIGADQNNTPTPTVVVVVANAADVRQQRAINDIRRARYGGKLTPPADAPYENKLQLRWLNELMKQRANEVADMIGPPDALDVSRGGVALWLNVKRRPDTAAAYSRLRIEDRSYFHEDRPADHEDGFFGYARIVCPRSIQLQLPQVSTSFTYYAAGNEAGSGCHFFGAIIASLSIMWQLANQKINLEDAMPEYGARIKKLMTEEMKDKESGSGTPLADAYEKLYLGWADESRIGAAISPTAAARGGVKKLPFDINFATWNMNGIARTQKQWLDILRKNPAWQQKLLGNGDRAVIAVALQEVNDKDKLGQALETHINKLWPKKYTLLKSKLRSVVSKEFGQNLMVWVKPAIQQRNGAKPRQKSVCFGALRTCVKGSLIQTVPLASGTVLMIVGSHLPFDPKAKDLGFKQRTAAFKRTRSELEKLVPQPGGGAVVFWAGDLNYRKVPVGKGDRVTIVDQLESALRAQKPPYHGFHETPPEFDPTCKMQQCTNGRCPICRTKPVGHKGDVCYVESRNPSHCDRVLYGKLGSPAERVFTMQRYDTFNDIKSAITSHSDHDMVYASISVK